MRRFVFLSILALSLVCGTASAQRPVWFATLSLQAETAQFDTQDVLPLFKDSRTVVWPCLEAGVCLTRNIRVGLSAGWCYVDADAGKMSGVSASPFLQYVMHFDGDAVRWTPTAGLLFDYGHAEGSIGENGRYRGYGLYLHLLSAEIRIMDGLYVGADAGYVGWSYSSWDKNDERTAFNMDHPGLGLYLGGMRLRLLKEF